MSEPASIRYKNPGAMWGSPLAIKWGADPHPVKLNDGLGQGNNIAVFPTYVQGICAQLDLWRTSKNYKNKTFAKAIATWSGGNSVESYIAFVLKRVPGMTRNTVMDDVFWKSSDGIAFLKAQAWHEAGKKYPAPDADWIEAQRRVFGGVKQTKPAPLPPPPDIPKPEPKQHPAFWKRPFVWFGSLLTGGLFGGASLSVDAQFLWGLSGFVTIAFVLFLGWVYLVPPRGSLRKGLS